MQTLTIEQVVVTCLRWQIESVTGHTGLNMVIITLGNGKDKVITSWAYWREM